MSGTTPACLLENLDGVAVLRLTSADGMNRLTRAAICELTTVLDGLTARPQPLVITGNEQFFSAGADLNEIAALHGDDAFRFSREGQELTRRVAGFRAPVVAAVRGHCFGGGLDLALACHRRIAAPNAVFGHRGAAFGVITGWGGTQRLPRLVGRARALQMFCAAEKVTANDAMRCGLVESVLQDPVAAAVEILGKR